MTTPVRSGTSFASPTRHPYEMGYFNAPSKPGTPLLNGNFAMSAPAFVPQRNEIWYTDGFHGFFVIRMTKGKPVTDSFKKAMDRLGREQGNE